MMRKQASIFVKPDYLSIDETDTPSTQTIPADKIQSAPRQAFLTGMRQVATSVTVVTTDGPAGRHGATVSAFTSVSADPPTVLVCLRSNSRICSAISRNRVFTVSVLPEHKRELARTFAKQLDDFVVDRFDGVDVDVFPGLAPGIHGASNFACTIIHLLEQHSHTIAVGHVAHVAALRQAPLIYHDGEYQRLSLGCDPGLA